MSRNLTVFLEGDNGQLGRVHLPCIPGLKQKLHHRGTCYRVAEVTWHVISEDENEVYAVIRLKEIETK